MRSRCAGLEAELQVQTTQTRLAQLDGDEQQTRARQLQAELEELRQRHRQETDRQAASTLGQCCRYSTLSSGAVYTAQ